MFEYASAMSKMSCSGIRQREKAVAESFFRS